MVRVVCRERMVCCDVMRNGWLPAFDCVHGKARPSLFPRVEGQYWLESVELAVS